MSAADQQTTATRGRLAARQQTQAVQAQLSGVGQRGATATAGGRRRAAAGAAAREEAQRFVVHAASFLVGHAAPHHSHTRRRTALATRQRDAVARDEKVTGGEAEAMQPPQEESDVPPPANIGGTGRLRRNSLQAELDRQCRHVPNEDFKILSGMSGLWDRPQVSPAVFGRTSVSILTFRRQLSFAGADGERRLCVLVGSGSSRVGSLLSGLHCERGPSQTLGMPKAAPPATTATSAALQMQSHRAHTTYLCLQQAGSASV